MCVRFRFSSLFHDDKLGHCLDKDDPQLTLVTLQLLYQLVRSPSIAELICLHNNVACLPLICYQCLLEPTPNANDKDIIFKIRLQVHVISGSFHMHIIDPCPPPLPERETGFETNNCCYGCFFQIVCLVLRILMLK